MTIVQCNDSFRPIMDGVGVCMENYARHLARRGHRVLAVAPAAPGTPAVEPADERDGYTLLRYASVPLPGWRPYRLGMPRLDAVFAGRLRRWIRAAGGIDIVHSHSPFVAGHLARRVAGATGAVHVSTFHSKYRDDFLKSVPWPAAADRFAHHLVRFYGSVDAVWAPSEATASTLAAYGYPGTVSVAPNGSDIDPPAPGDLDEYRHRGASLLDIDTHDPFVVLFVGQHRWEKNLRLILDALARLGEPERAGIRAVFAGTGADEGAIRRYAATIGVAGICDFRGIVLDRTELTALYSRADLFVFPSVYDNAPLVVREAAACGTPSILAAGSTSAAGTADDRNAFHVDPQPDALAALIASLRADPERVARVGAGARREVFRSWADVVGEAEHRYLEISRHDGYSERRDA